MYFPESAAIAREHPDIQIVVERIDAKFASIFSSAPLRPGDFSVLIGADENQVVGIFELFARQGILSRVEMVECQICHNLMPVTLFRQAMDDEDDFECSSCGRTFHRRTQPVSVYRLTTATLAKARPIALKPKTNETSDEPLGERAQSVLIAMSEMELIDSDHRQSTEDIAKQAFGFDADANSLKNVMLELKTLQMIDSKTGRGGGCWLTEKGRTRAEKLRKQ